MNQPQDILAIVGSEKWPNPAGLRAARIIIEMALDTRRPDGIVSGGADGIDRLAARIADERAIPCREFLPRQRRWEPYGFKERNIEIVNTCTRLLVIRCASSTTYGSGWTADLAQKRGKPVERYEL